MVLDLDCIVVGGGPAGLMLSMLLARKGVQVQLFEEHNDFERDFRGDTVHPSTLEVLDQLGMADRLLAMPHGKLQRVMILTAEGEQPLVDLSTLPGRFPYIAMIPQSRFLDFLSKEARQFPSFHLSFGCHVQDFLYDGDRITGVRYRSKDGWQDVRAPLVIAADGRFSRLRQLSSLPMEVTSPPMDVLWIRIPKEATDPAELPPFCAGEGHMLVVLAREDTWQLGFIIPKGTYKDMHDPAGLERIREKVGSLQPLFAGRARTIVDWKQISLLSVESSRMKRWYRPGLLLIGDAAHVMSPVGGVGINYAIQDAVEASNLLAGPLKARNLTIEHLAAFQKRRYWPTWLIQSIQAGIQRTIVQPALFARRVFRLPLSARILSRIPILRSIPARIFGKGLRQVRVE